MPMGKGRGRKKQICRGIRTVVDGSRGGGTFLKNEDISQLRGSSWFSQEQMFISRNHAFQGTCSCKHVRGNPRFFISISLQLPFRPGVPTAVSPVVVAVAAGLPTPIFRSAARTLASLARPRRVPLQVLGSGDEGETQTWTVRVSCACGCSARYVH